MAILRLKKERAPIFVCCYFMLYYGERNTESQNGLTCNQIAILEQLCGSVWMNVVSFFGLRERAKK